MDGGVGMNTYIFSLLHNDEIEDQYQTIHASNLAEAWIAIVDLFAVMKCIPTPDSIVLIRIDSIH